jgi:hypothetical protein
MFFHRGSETFLGGLENKKKFNVKKDSSLKNKE